MTVGAGTLGFASGLRTFGALVGGSAWTKRVLAEARPALIVSSWSVHAGSTYVATVRHTFMDVLVAVTGVRHGLSLAPLLRAETLGDCVATAGSFFYDTQQAGGSLARWDGTLAHWDTPPARWDEHPRLYVHLQAGANPMTTTIAAEMSFWFSAAGDIVPDLGAERLANHGFESWPDGRLSGWIASVNGGSCSITEDALVISGGARSARLTNLGGIAERWDGIAKWDDAGLAWDRPVDPLLRLSQPVRLRTGAVSRLSGAYRTDESNDPTFRAYLRLGIPGAEELIAADGFSTDGGHLVLANTGGEWRRFVLEFREWTDSDAGELELRVWNGGGGDSFAPSGTVWFDDVRLRRVWRYAFAAPRLYDVPPSRQSSRDVYFGGKTVGGGVLGLVNADGLLEPQLAQLVWEGAEVRLLAGGDFASGERLLLEEYRPFFSGFIDTQETTDERIALELRDTGELLNIEIPQETYTEAEFADLAEAFSGRPKPLLFGPKANISGVPVSRSASGYRTYEICSVAGSPQGIHTVTAVHAYADTRAADDRDPARRVTLVPEVDYATDRGAARLSILSDVKLYEIKSDHNKLDFDEGGPVLAATLTPGLYIARSLAAHVETQIRAVGAANHAFTYDDGGHRFTWARSAGTLNLRIQSGPNRAVGAWSLLSFTASGVDRTGLLTYTGDEPTFTDADREHVVRVDAVGLADDASGTFTGTAGAPIRVLPDIVRYLVTVLARRPDAVDDFSFLQARKTAPQVLGLYLQDRTNLRDVLDMLETSCGADIVVDGDGMYYVTVGDNAVPPNVVDLYDRDFLSFSTGSTIRDVLHKVTVNYDRDPSTERWLSREATNPAVPLAHKRSPARAFDTCLTSIADVVARTAAIAAQGSGTKRLATVEIKGKLTAARVGSKVRLWRTRGVDATGALAGVLFRVLSIDKTPLDSVAKATLLEV